jgi:hypothetical protein
MSRLGQKSFLQIDEADLFIYAEERAAEIDLIIAAPFQPGVLENLTALQAHALRVSAALQDLDAPAVEARLP